MAKKYILVANWKMNPGTLKEAERLVGEYKKFNKNLKADLVIAPPALYLAPLTGKYSKNFLFAAQNIFWEEKGAYTGEVSASMVSELKVKYTILGHSERRRMGETSLDTSKKIKSALKEKITPIVCIGEEDRDEKGEYMDTLNRQIEESLKGILRKDIEKVIIAYEPVWAIGKSEEEGMKSHDIYSMTIFIRRGLSKLFGKENAEKVKIIYGGAVGPKNAKDIIRESHIDGFLVGHQSLKSKNFEEIYTSLI